jgi:hypothetical protein
MRVGRNPAANRVRHAVITSDDRDVRPMSSTANAFTRGQVRAEREAELDAVPPVDRFLSALAGALMAGCDVWTPDAVLDATVPEWRFRCVGPDAIRTEYGRWFADPAHFESLRRMPIAGGEVVEYTLVWSEKGVPHTGHHLHVFELTGGLISRDTVFCGGRWPASLLAEMEAAQAATDPAS